MFVAYRNRSQPSGGGAGSAILRSIEPDQGRAGRSGYDDAMAEDDDLRAKLERYRYLLTMISDPEVRAVLREEVAAIERRLAPTKPRPQP